MEVRPIDADALIDKLEGINPVDYGAMSSYEAHTGARDALSDAIRYVNDAPTLSLNTLRDEIYEDAVAHGLWEEHDKEQAEHAEFCLEYPQYAFDLDEGNRRECVLYILSECFELRDAITAEEYAEELADIVIMCMSVAGKLGIDIDAEIRRKMEINRGRPWKHRK